MSPAESGSVGDLDEVITTAERVATEWGSLGLMRWGRFTRAMGGSAIFEVLNRKFVGPAYRRGNPKPRYLYTCRCGMIDFRHFYQLMYVALVTSEERAVEMGIEHEETAAPESRYAPEDVTSNALGAEFGSHQSIFQRVSVFVANLRSFLEQCDPVDWHALTPTQQQCIIDYYALDRGGNAHRRQTAGGDGDPCSVCSGASGFPFALDSEHPRITGRRERE